MENLSVNEKRVAWVLPLLVSALTFVIFLPTLKNGFVNWDDIQNLIANQKYRGLGYEQLKWMFTSYNMGPYAPITLITMGIDYSIWGMNPFGYHLTNILFHTLNALVFYLLCIKLLALSIPPSTPNTQRELHFSAAFAALFFAIHPLRVESASWVSGRHDIISCLFYLLAIIYYVSSRAPGGENTPFWRRHILPLAIFLLALLSKGMAISLPLVLVVLDIYPLGRLSGDPRKWLSAQNRIIWLEKIPFFILAAIFGSIGYICQANSGALTSYQEFGFVPRATQVLFAVFFYIEKTLIPLDLSPLYKLPPGFSLPNWQSLFEGSAIAAITTIAITLRRRRPEILAAWVYYLLTLSPVIGIVKINSQSAADRYTYLPCLGFAVLAGAALRTCRLSAGRLLRHICAIFGCLILSCLAFLTWKQEGIWRDTETLWRHALAVNPDLDSANNNVGLILAAQGKTDEAEIHYRRALKSNPQSAHAYNNLGGLLAAQGKLNEASGHYREALRINPNYAEAYYNLGIVISRQGKNNEAAQHYREALRINPNLAQAHYNLGLILAAEGNPAEAVWHYQEALRVNPSLAQAHNNLGGILGAQGKHDEAARHYREAVKINPGYAEAHNNLGGIMAAQGKTNEAAKHYREALKSNPNYAQAHNNLGGIMATQGKLVEAAEHYREAVRLNPNYAEAYYNLGLVLAVSGKAGEAERYYRKALEINPAISATKRH